MQAVTVDDGRLVVAERPDPQPGRGELLVRVAAAGINGADLHQVRGAYPAPPGSPPDIPGLELAGEVAAVGPGVFRFGPGDRVMAVVGGGGQAELAVVHERAAMPVPDELGWPEAGGFPEVVTTAHDALFTQAGLGLGDRLLVHGAAGGVGSLFVQLARARGAQVVASASGQREALLRGLGVEVFLDRHAGRVAERACRAIGQELDMVADLVGYGTLAASLPMVREGGRAGSIVELAGDLEPAVDRNLTLEGVLVRPSRAVLEVLAAAVADGSLRPVVDQVLDLADAAVAHRRVESRHGQGKVVLRVAG
jgi:NADPH:quinone reductase-like Zn-dependent oxidoreductase